jgi:hypothetical protein
MIAIAAIDRSAGTRFEGNLGFFAAFGTCDCVHLTGGRRRKGLVYFSLSGLNGFASSPGGATSGTTLGRMIMPLSTKGLLFLYREGIGIAAVMTN